MIGKALSVVTGLFAQMVPLIPSQTPQKRCDLFGQAPRSRTWAQFGKQVEWDLPTVMTDTLHGDLLLFAALGEPTTASRRSVGDCPI
jgi:hypothetical protein